MCLSASAYVSVCIVCMQLCLVCDLKQRCCSAAAAVAAAAAAADDDDDDDVDDDDNDDDDEKGAVWIKP